MNVERVIVAHSADFSIDGLPLRGARGDGVKTLLSQSVLARDRGIHVRCPHCNKLLEPVTEAGLECVDCLSCGSSISLVNQAHQPGAVFRLGHFELLERLGVGAVGTVWKARDQELDRIVALKIPRGGQLAACDETKFVAEARAAARLHHPYIVPVHEVGHAEGTIYIVSEYVPGVSLSDLLEDRPLTLSEAATFACQIAEALAHAHGQGVIHRDIKPQNVLIDAEGMPHLTDFGLAKRISGEVTMTVHGAILGTPAYMSPEQACGEGDQATPAMDIYSLGVVLFQLLTRELPFRGAPEMLLHQAIHREPPGLRRLDAAIPRDLETICLKCLEKDSAHRYLSAAEVVAELQRWLDGKSIETRPIAPMVKMWRWLRRNPAIGSLILSGLALLVGLAISMAWITSERNIAQRAAHNERIAAADARQQSQLASLSAKEARAQHLRAEENLEKSREAIDRLFSRVATDLAGRPHMAEIRQSLLENALEFYQGFMEQESEAPGIRRGAAIAYLRVSGIEGMLGNQEQGIKSARQALAIAEQLVEDFPDHVQNQGLLAEVKCKLAKVLMRRGKNKEAEQQVRSMIEILEPLIEEFPGIVEYYRILHHGYVQLALALFSQQRPLEAVEAQRKAIELNGKYSYSKLGPLMNMGWASYNLGMLVYHEGHLEEAAECFRESIDRLETIMAESSENSVFQLRARDMLSWVLGTCPLPQFRNPPRALALCEWLIRRDPLHAEYWQNYGIALYRSGRYGKAITALRRSMQHRNGGSTIDRYYLAMSHWQRGEHDQARGWYEQVMEIKKQFMANHNVPYDADVLAARQEAETLMGIQGTKLQGGE